MGEHRLPLHLGSPNEISSGISGWSCCELSRKSFTALRTGPRHQVNVCGVGHTKSAFMYLHSDSLWHGVEEGDLRRQKARRGTGRLGTVPPSRVEFSSQLLMAGEHFGAGAHEGEDLSGIQWLVTNSLVRTAVASGGASPWPGTFERRATYCSGYSAAMRWMAGICSLLPGGDASTATGPWTWCITAWAGD
jgi:hypothetical protein